MKDTVTASQVCRGSGRLPGQDGGGKVGGSSGSLASHTSPGTSSHFLGPPLCQGTPPIAHLPIVRAQGGWEGDWDLQGAGHSGKGTTVMCFPDSLSSVCRDSAPWHQSWGTRESSRTARSGGQNCTTQGIPNPKTHLQGPDPQPLHVAALSQPLQLLRPCSLRSRPYWPHSAAQMHQAHLSLEPANGHGSLCPECSSPSSSYSCLLLSS